MTLAPAIAYTAPHAALANFGRARRCTASKSLLFLPPEGSRSKSSRTVVTVRLAVKVLACHARTGWYL
eukprot:COSAG01_NODE_36_length_34092_cov_26.350032_22_plen_68_part_00